MRDFRVTRLLILSAFICLLCGCSGAEDASITASDVKKLAALCEEYGGVDYYKANVAFKKVKWARCTNGIYTYNLKKKGVIEGTDNNQLNGGTSVSAVVKEEERK